MEPNARGIYGTLWMLLRMKIKQAEGEESKYGLTVAEVYSIWK